MATHVPGLLAQTERLAKARDEAVRSKLFTEEWYAVRLQMIRDHAEKNGWLMTYANIVANGREDIQAPHTYQQQMELLRWDRDEWERKAKAGEAACLSPALAAENKRLREALLEVADMAECAKADYNEADMNKIAKAARAAAESP
jgi:hypothetical protein